MRAQSPGCRAAFSLVELIVVIAVIAVLVSILLPSLHKAREDARRTVCLAHLKQVGAGLFAYAALNREDGPAVMSPVRRIAPRQLLSRPRSTENLGLLWPRMIGDAREFHCPSQREFSYPANLKQLPEDYVAGSYAYAVHVPAGQSPRLGAIRHLALASDDFTAGPDHWGVGRSSHRNGYNVLYTDGSVTWYPDQAQAIWKRKIYWDDETDDVTYSTFYRMGRTGGQPGSGWNGGYGYGAAYDLFRVWWSFCYHRPVNF